HNAYLFSASVRDNLIYGLWQRPIVPPTRDEATERVKRKWFAESRRAGNLDLDIEADWTDYQAAGVAGPAELTERLVEVLAAVDMEEEVFQLGLRGTINPKARPDIAKAILQARTALQERLADQDLQNLVEVFDPERYNTNATMAENLLFG